MSCSYEKIYEEVQALEPVHVFHRWMRVDGRSMKSALLNIIKKWSYMFKQHLVDLVTNRYGTQTTKKVTILASIHSLPLIVIRGSLETIPATVG